MKRTVDVARHPVRSESGCQFLCSDQYRHWPPHGLRSPGLQKELLALEARQSELETTMAVIPPSAPRFHPRLADLYRQRVTELHEALNDPDARAEAAAILRTLVGKHRCAAR